MMNKMNLAELLKDCASGVELYSPLFGDCKFVKVHDYEAEIIVEIETGANVSFKTDGRYYDYPNAECLLFPKGKTTWEGFTPPCNFKDGDVIYTYNFIAILSHIAESGAVWYHCYYCISTKNFNAKHYCGIGNINYDEFRIATEAEKAKLFQAIKDNGYTWNEETKTLDKLMKFKDGDIVFTRTSKYDWVSIFKQFSGNTYHTYGDLHIYSNNLFTNTHILCDIEEINTQRLATKEEKQKLFDAIEANGYKWNKENKTLVKLPKFNVGDKVKSKMSENIFTVIDIKDDVYIFSRINDRFGYHVPFRLEKDYELVHRKFDINTLKPFESEVLVRDTNTDKWRGAFYSYYNSKKFYTIGSSYYYQCIPYKGNEYLLGTTDDCDEYFKIWE